MQQKEAKEEAEGEEEEEEEEAGVLYRKERKCIFFIFERTVP